MKSQNSFTKSLHAIQSIRQIQRNLKYRSV